METGLKPRRLAAHRARPEIGDLSRAVRVRRIQVGQFLFRHFLDLVADPAQFVGQSRPVARDVLQHPLGDQAGDRVEIAGEGDGAEAQRLKRDRVAAYERVHNQRWLRAVGNLHHRPFCIHVGESGRVVPIGEIGDQRQDRPPQAPARLDRRRTVLRPSVHGEQDAPGVVLEHHRTIGTARTWQQQCHRHRP